MKNDKNKLLTERIWCYKQDRNVFVATCTACGKALICQVIENAKRSKKTKQLLISIAASPHYVKQLKYPLLYNVF